MKNPARHRSARSWKHADEIIRDYAAGHRVQFGVGNRYQRGPCSRSSAMPSTMAAASWSPTSTSMVSQRRCS